MRIGVVSLPRSFGLEAPIRTNTGNYMFTEAAYRNVAGNPVWIGFNFDPIKVNAEFDHVLIPAANWINKSDALSGLVPKLKQIELPITCVGLGAQANSISEDPEKIELSDTSVDLARTISSKSQYVSVRGDFTRRVLLHLGVSNAVVTGCPSLYMDLPVDKSVRKTGDVVLQGTRYNMNRSYLGRPSLDSKIFSIAGKAGVDMIYQSEQLEISFLDGSAGGSWDADVERSGLDKLYGLAGASELREYLAAHGKVFTSIDAWSEFLCTRFGVIGTRLHGAILALNSGTPAALLPHDSRTQEILEFASIPTGNPDDLINENTKTPRLPDDILDQVGSFYERREQNRVVYEQFLSANGLSYVRSTSGFVAQIR